MLQIVKSTTTNLPKLLCFNNCIIIIIIIMTHRRLRCDDSPQCPRSSALCHICFQLAVVLSPICCIYVFRGRPGQEVFASSYLSSGQLSLQWLASTLGVRVRWYQWLTASTVLPSTMPKQCVTFLVAYVSNVRQASCTSYVDVLHVILPSDAQYLTLASHVKRLQPADIIC